MLALTTAPAAELMPHACIPWDLISEVERVILTIGQPRISIMLALACVASLNTAHTIVSRDWRMPTLYWTGFNHITGDKAATHCTRIAIF